MSARMTIAVIALAGLAAMWVFPAPLLWGVLIGALCLLTIAVATFNWAAGRIYDRIAGRLSARREHKAVHGLTGIKKRERAAAVAVR